MHWIVDGMNLIGSRPDGWWRDRPGARRRLIAEMEPLAAAPGERVTVVFDGRPQDGEEAQAVALGVASAFAPGGPNAADDRIVAMVSAALSDEDTLVVTSDGGLRRRVEASGVAVMGVSAFRQLQGSRSGPSSDEPPPR